MAIGMTGFEPATSCSQSKRATKLRYIPLLPCSILGYLQPKIEHGSFFWIPKDYLKPLWRSREFDQYLRPYERET